jgi:CDP-6-deoxy-D-xylo-4-hexulose-3-dehydrase
MTINYPLAKSSWGPEEIKAILQIITSDRYSMGSKVAEFEKAFAKKFGSEYAVMVNSGSSANLLAVAAMFFRQHGPKLNRGDVVVVPAVSWSTTYFPLSQYGLKLRFVDVDIDTLNYDLDGLQKALALEPKPKMVMAVNLLGNPNDFDRIREMMVSGDCILIEDNCESMGASYHLKQTGTFGLLGTFSFFFSHHISTMEGGMIITNDKELYHILLSLRAHGWTRNLPKTNMVTSTKSGNLFEESYKFVLPGYNVRPLEMSGAIGFEQLQKFDEMIRQRQLNWSYLELTVVRRFSDYFWFQKEIGRSSWFGFSLVCKPGKIERTHVLSVLDEHGIEYRPIVAGNFTRNPVMKYIEHEMPEGGLPNADLVHDQGFFVGNDGSSSLHNEIELLATALGKAIKHE